MCAARRCLLIGSGADGIEERGFGVTALVRKPCIWVATWGRRGSSTLGGMRWVRLAGGSLPASLHCVLFSILNFVEHWKIK